MTQHMVIFQNPDGDPGYNQFESVEDAVGFVEQLRNEQGIDSIRIFELEEVKFDLKPYYRVELQALTTGSSGSSSAPSSSGSAPSAPSSSPESSASSAPSAPSAPTPPSTPSDPSSSSPFASPSEPSAPRFPASAPSAPAAPTPPSDQPSDDDTPTRRGLFGR